MPEEDASGEGYILEVCVELFSGELDREVVIRVEGQDGSAIGKQCIHGTIHAFDKYYYMVQSEL